MATIKSGDMFWSFSELKSSLPKNVQESMSAQGVVQKAKRLFAGKPEEQKVAIQTAIELGADIKGVESGFIEIESEAKKNGYDVAYSYDRNTRTIQTYLIPSESFADARTMTANKIAESFPVIASPIEVKGEISFHGMPGISRFYADETADNKMMLVTTQRKMLDAAIGALKSKRTQEALRQRNKQESESSIRAAQQRAMSSVNVAGNYVPVSQEGRQARSGTGTPMQKLVREATLQFDDYLSEIIRKNAKDLWRQNKERDSFYRYNAKLMQGMQLIANIFSYYPPDEAMEIIRKNPNLRIITESAAWKTGGIKAELRQLASLGFNAGLSGESSFSHYETSLIPKSYHAGGSFDQSSSRKRQQVAKYAELQAEAIRKRESSAKSRRGMLFSKEEIKAGVKPRGAEERTYGLIDVTQEEYAKVVRDLVAKGKIDKKYLYSGIGLDALAMSEDVREEFNSLLRHSGKVNKKEFSDYVSQLKAKNPKISDEKAQKQALATLLGIEGDFDIVGKRKSAGEDWRYEYTTPLDAKSGTKLLTKAGYGRSSTNFIDPLIIRAIMERRFGREISDDEFAKIGVHGVRAAGKIKAKEIPGKITEALSQVFSEVEEIDGTIDATKVRAIEQIINRSPLRGYITYNESNGIFQTDGSKLREIAAGEAGEKQLASIIAAINDMGNAVGIGSLFDISVVQDKDTGKDMRHYDMSKNFIARTAIRQIDETPYGAPGGAVFSADYRARGAMNRMIALSASGQNFGTFQNYMSEVMGQTPEQKKHLAQMREDTQSAIENTLKTLRDDFVINPEDTTVGHGSQYKINLDDYAEIDDEIFDHMKNGIIDPEYFKKTSYYQIQEAMKNGTVYYDPQMFGGYFSEFDEKTGKTFGGSMAALGTFDVVPIVGPNNDVVGYKLNQNRLSAFRSMDFASQSARQTADEYDINRANAMAVKYYTDLQNDVQNKEGITFATDTKRRLLHSSMSKSAAGNYGEIALAREDLADALSRGDYKTAAEKSQIIKQLTTAVTFNPSDLLDLLSGQEQMVLSSETLQDALGNEYEQWSTHKVAETDEERAAALETYYQQLYGTDSSGFLEEERKWPEKGFEKAKAAIGADLKERIDRIKEAQKTIGNAGYYDESGVMHYIGFDSENNPIEVADEVDASAEAFAQLRINQANERAARLLKDAETFYDKNADKRDKDVSSNTWAQRILASHLVKSVTTGSAEYNKRMSSAAEDLEQGKGNGTIEGLFGWLFRFPLSSGLDDKATEIFADEGVSKGSARAGLGVWQELNGDNDGDKLATLMTFGDGKKIMTALKNGDTKTLIDQARIVVQKQNRISSAVSMAKEREIKESESAKSGFSEKDLSALTKKEADRTGAILARYNKQKTGSLSNEYQGVAEAMTNLGIDEIGIGSDVSSQRSAANAMITRALFEATTQEAISSKKVADRIEAKYGNGALSDENSKFYHELDDLIKDLSKEDTFNKEENLKALKSRMIEMGILGDGEDAFDSRISARVLETIAEYSNGRAVLESIFGKDTVTDEFMNRIRRGEVNLSADQVFSAVSATNQRLSSIGGIGGAVRKKYSQVEGLSDASWNPAAALGKAIGENNPAFKKYNDTLKEIKNSVDAEAKSEQTKIGIAEKEAAVILKLAGVYGGLGETLDKVKLANEALNSANWNTDPVGITNLLQKQFGVTYEDRGFGRTVGSFGATGEVAIEGRRYKIAGFKQGDKIPGVESRKWVDENGKEITDQDLIARLNRMGYDEKDYKRLSKTFGAMDYGNIAHTTQEIVSTLGLRLPDFENISSYEDFRNIIEKRIQEFLNSKNKEERELGKYAQGLWTEQEVDGRGGGVDVYVQKYRDALQLIGKTGAEIEEAIRNFVNIGIHYSDIATQGGRKDLEILSEERVGVPVYGTSVNSAIDSLVYDPITGKVTYRDFKTKGGKVGGHELAQLYSYIFGDQAAALRIAGIEDETSDTIGRELDYDEFKNNIADAFGYTADKPMSQKRFNVLKKVISAARKRAEERAQRENVDTSGKAFKNIFIDEIYSAFEGSIVRGSEEGGDSTYLDTAMLSRRASGPLADVLRKITNREQISEEDEKILEEHGYVGQGAYDRWGERPGSSYYKEKEEAAEQEAQEKSLKSDYIKLLKEQYDLLIKIDAVKEKMRRAEERGERTTGFEEDLKILQKAKRSISRQMHSDKFADLTDDEDIQNAEDVQKHRRKSKKATLGLGGAEEQLAYFEKYAERRIGLEAKIEDATIKAQTAQTTNARKSFENLKTIYVKHLSDTDEIFEKLSAIVKEKFPEQFDEINKRMEEQRALLFAQRAASNRGNRTIFDVIKSDIQRATMRITDFGIAARVLNTARKEIQQVYQNILKLDEAMTNLRIVTGSNTEQAKSMMNTYNDLAMQLGTTTQAVAQSAAEWLRQGYSVSEANELIKSSTYLSRLGFMDMGQSVTALTSVMKGFRIEATDSMDIVDKLTQLDAKYATTAGDIATALSRTSAVAREAGLDLDQTAAALTTMIDVSQQDASSVGNAFRTILARYGNVKATAFTSLVGDSEDIDDANGSINDTEKVLRAIGIKIRSSSSDMRDFDDVMDELADKWVALTGVEKNAVSTALAGVRQRNLFGIYMENYSTYKQAISEAEKAEGTAARKMQAYNESVAYSINQLSTAWEGFTQKLEASGAVKLFFNGLTLLINNLGTALSMVLSTVVSLRSFKLTTDLKRLADFFGFADSKGEGHLKAKWSRTKSWFNPNRMTQQAAQEKEKYEQQKAGTYEEQSRNKVVNSNNRVVDALNRNVDALDRNSAAQRGEKATQTGGGKPSTGSSTNQTAEPVESAPEVHRKGWLGLTGSTISGGTKLEGFLRNKKLNNLKKSLPEAESRLEKYENYLGVYGSTNDYVFGQYGKARNDVDHIKSQIAEIESTEDNYQRTRQLRAQELKANWKQGAIRGIGTGLTAGIISGMSAEGDVQDKIVAGASTAITTGLLSAIPGVGTILGPILGPVLGGFFGKEINKLLKADEVARKERVEEAKKQLEAIKGIGNSVTGLIDLNKKDQALWDSDEWKQFNEQVETINEALKKSELGIIKLGNSTQTLSEYFKEAVSNGNKDMLARVEAERIRFEAEKTYAAGEQDRYTLQKEINENQKELADLDEDETSKQKELNAAIKAARAEIESYSEALKKGYMQASFYSSGVGTMESYDIGNATLDRVIMQIAREWAKDSPDIFAGNQLTSDARSEIISYLREQSGYSSLFKNDTKNVGDMLTARDAVGELRKSLNMSQKQLKEFANSKDLSKISDKLGATGDALYKIIDQINLVDEDGITTIAHAMNMTVQEFEKANADGAFNWLTTDVAIGGIDKLNEKMQTFNDLLSAASEGSLLTSENLNKIANQFPTLLRGVDEAGEYTTDLSSDNILDNIIRMMTDEDSLREIYSGLFSGSVAKDSEIWSNFMTLGKGSEIASDINLSEDIKNRVKTAGSYSDIVDIFSLPEMEKYNDAFKEYVTSMYPITDLLDTQAKILEEYGKHTLETEISNLESVRDSLDDVNKQREKELELIKAKEALENASKEKKRVYRAGVGFVYTTDQEAVKSAQEKVDELERQRDKDNIQYQIDSLQQQKEILENIENNKQLESLIDTAEKILDGDGSSGGIAGIIAAVKLITGDEFTNKIKEQIKAGIDESTQKTNEETKNTALKNYEEAKSNLEGFYEEEYVTSTGEGTGLTKKQILNTPTSPYYSSVYDEYKSKISDINKYADDYNNYVQDESQKVSKEKEDESKQKFGFTASPKGLKGVAGAGGKRVRNKQGQEIILSQDEIGFVFGVNPNSNPNWEDNKQYIAGESSNIYISKQNADGSFSEFRVSSWPGSAKEAIEQVSGPALIVNNDGPKDYLIYKDANGEIHNTIIKRSDGSFQVDGELKSDAFFEKSRIDSKNIESPYASGTLSASGGRSLINENGLESIITPSGTITSLPAKSGIVPADLTRNLWALGEVAPNLIARLGGNSLQTNNSNSSTDNSINIQNLDATFHTQSDFDGRRFLTDLRNQVILTANNH